MPQLISRTPVTIASGASLSAAVTVRGGLPAVIEMPAAWDAANLTFQTAGDGGSYLNLYDENGSEITITAAASHRIRLDASQWTGICYLKIRSGTAGTPVTQSADRTLYLEIWE